MSVSEHLISPFVYFSVREPRLCSFCIYICFLTISYKKIYRKRIQIHIVQPHRDLSGRKYDNFQLERQWKGCSNKILSRYLVAVMGELRVFLVHPPIKLFVLN